MRPIRSPAEGLRLIEQTPKTISDSLKGRIPVAESIIPLDDRGRRDWGKLSDERLLSYVGWFMEVSGVRGRKELEVAISGLYKALLKRERKCPGIIDRVGFESMRLEARDWKAMGDDELFAYAKRFMKEKGISWKEELKKADPGLYHALLKRQMESPGIIDRIGFEKKMKRWSTMGDDELVAYAKDIMKKEGIRGKTELLDREWGLYQALLKRENVNPGIIERIGFEEKQRLWRDLSDDELVEYAKKFLRERGIHRKIELVNSNRKLYYALYTREKKNPGIMERVGFEEMYRYWRAMSNDEIVAYARHFIEESGICCVGQLRKADSGLYEALRVRMLLDDVFSHADHSKHMDAVDSVIDAIGSFCDDGKVG